MKVINLLSKKSMLKSFIIPALNSFITPDLYQVLNCSGAKTRESNLVIRRGPASRNSMEVECFFLCPLKVLPLLLTHLITIRVGNTHIFLQIMLNCCLYIRFIPISKHSFYPDFDPKGAIKRINH